MATIFRDIRDKINENYDKAITVDDLARYTMELCEACDKTFAVINAIHNTIHEIVEANKAQGEVNRSTVSTFQLMQTTIADLHGLIEKLARKEGK